jgi:thiosulfate/3-mercaptopyruvate sulfurtransferase
MRRRRTDNHREQPRVTPLITVDELAAALAAARRPALLDVRWRLAGPPGLETYRSGHLPGAHYVDLDSELAGPPGAAGRHPLPSGEVFATAMSRAGVHRHRDVVVYDDTDGTAAARAWWLLRWFGHKRVQLLDGGYPAWQAAGHPVTTQPPVPEHADFVPVPGGMAVLDAAAAALVARQGVLLDARAPERYRGEIEPVDAVAGHIPGAVSAPTTDNLGPDARFRPITELTARFDALGTRPGVEVATYCGSGVTAAHQVLALELVGIRGALYPGSWSEWVADPTRPVAAGPDPG